MLFRELSYDENGYVCLMAPIDFIKDRRAILLKEDDPHPYREHVVGSTFSRKEVLLLNLVNHQHESTSKKIARPQPSKNQVTQVQT